MIDYRGYVKSAGVPTEKALYKDAEYIWNWAKKTFNYPKYIIYLGFFLCNQHIPFPKF